MVRLRFNLQSIHLNIPLTLFHILRPLKPNYMMMMERTNSLIFFHSEHDNDHLDVDLQILQDWLVIAPFKIFYTVSTVLFHEYGRENADVTNWVSHFYMFVPTKANVKLDHSNTGHAQVIGNILCSFPNWFIIYPVVPVKYTQVTLPTPSHQVPLNFMLDFKILCLNLINIVTLLTL